MENVLLLAFEAERTRLVSLGYRLTGSFADAEDAVQEAWLRLEGTAADEIVSRNMTLRPTTPSKRLCATRTTVSQPSLYSKA